MDLPATIKASKKKTYTASSLLASGDIADIYATTTGEVLKIARASSDNDLLDNEAAVLGRFRAKKKTKLNAYLPPLVEWPILRDRGNVRMNVFTHEAGFVSLADIIAAYPGGINYQDLVWMYKRLLVAIGFAHLNGVIHGAVLPAHVLVHPTGHGAKLIDWCYALDFTALPKPAPDPATADPAPPAPAPVNMNAWDLLKANNYADPYPDPVDPGPALVVAPADPNRMFIRAISVDSEAFYAPEILRKMTPTPATDLYMAAKCAVALLGGNVETDQIPDTVPVPIRAFFSGSLLRAPEKRPQDAWDLHEEFDKLLQALVGPPKYRAFSMPPEPGSGVLLSGL